MTITIGNAPRLLQGGGKVKKKAEQEIRSYPKPDIKPKMTVKLPVSKPKK